MWVLNFYLDSYLIWVKFNFITKQIKQDCVPIKIKLWVRIKTRYEFVKGWEIILRVGKYFKKNIWEHKTSYWGAFSIVSNHPLYYNNNWLKKGYKIENFYYIFFFINLYEKHIIYNIILQNSA